MMALLGEIFTLRSIFNSLLKKQAIRICIVSVALWNVNDKSYREQEGTTEAPWNRFGKLARRLQQHQPTTTTFNFALNPPSPIPKFVNVSVPFQHTCYCLRSYLAISKCHQFVFAEARHNPKLLLTRHFRLFQTCYWHKFMNEPRIEKI